MIAKVWVVGYFMTREYIRLVNQISMIKLTSQFVYYCALRFLVETYNSERQNL